MNCNHLKNGKYYPQGGDLAFLRICFHLRLPLSMFSNQLREKCPVSLFQSMVSYLPGAGKEAFRRAGNARFPRQGDTGGRIQWEDGQLPAAGQTPGNSFGRHGRTCSVCPSAPMSGFGHAACRNGRKRTPGRDSPCAKVQAQESENPFTHVRDCRGKPTA